jgi:preprotein translocase subunit YajC
MSLFNFNPSASSIVLAFQEPSGGLGAFTGLIPMVLIFGIFYMLLILPMRKRQKALQTMVQNLKKGDKVVTSGGLFGEVSGVEEATVLLRIADNVRVRVAKSAISGLEGESEKSDKGSAS